MTENLIKDKILYYTVISSSILFYLYVVYLSFNFLFNLVELSKEFQNILLLIFFIILYYHFVFLVILIGLGQAIKLFMLLSNDDKSSYFKHKGSFLSNPPLQGIGIITLISGILETIYVVINISKFKFIQGIYYLIIYNLGSIFLISLTCIIIERLIYHIKKSIVYVNN